MRHLKLFTGPLCTLCDHAKELIAKIALDIPLALETQDITTDPELFERFRYVIPVIELEGQVVMAGKISELWLRKILQGEKIRTCEPGVPGSHSVDRLP